MLHRLLVRQLKRSGLAPESQRITPAQWRDLLERVSRSYHQSDQDRYTLERSLRISSDELGLLYEDLRRSSASALAAEHNKLERSLAVLSSTLDATPSAILVVDEDGRVLHVNRSFAEFWSDGEPVPNDASAVFERMCTAIEHPERFRSRVEELDRLRSETGHGEVSTKSGDVFEWYVSPVRAAGGHRIARLWVWRDVSRARKEALELERHVAERTAELSRANEQLRQAQKLEAIGRLAGGVAHDFNNMLSVILSYTDLLLTEAVGNEGLADLAEIERAAKRAATLTQQLLAFSRQQVLQVKVVDLNAVVNGLEGLLRPVIGEDIRLHTRLDRRLARVRVDPSQIEQVIMNLVLNARDAMPNGGELSISTENLGPDEIALSVQDTGIGMDEATRARIFEPFFTTKERGRGTGLGLATAYGTIEQSGGRIEVSSRPGAGSCFTIRLPRAREAPPRAVRKSSTPKLRAGSAEAVLLVEDDALVRRAARAILAKHGYTVLEAASGQAALEICRSDRRIDLVLTDVVMPEMSGPELAQRIRKLHHELPIVYMSGYTESASARQAAIENGARFLQKPFTPATLLRKIRDVIDEQMLPIPASARSG